MNELMTFDRLTPYAVGFDRLFDLMNRYTSNQLQSTGFPPYNIRKNGEDKFFIDLAVAGLKKEDLKIELFKGTLTVSSSHESVENNNMLFRGISYKKFTRKFTLDEGIVVNTASYKDGILTIELERIKPKENPVQVIPIQ